MASAIPIENLYYLLSYAWDHFHEGEEVDVSSASCPDLANLLAKVLAAGIHRLARSGFECRYEPVVEVTPRLRGRILVVDSYRRMTHRSGRMNCEFDELSGDTAANRILHATAGRLLGVRELTAENRHELRLAREQLPAVTPIRVTDSSFHRIQLHRNTRRYGLLLSICRLVHQSFLPEEQQGSRRFRDILRDETIMHRLFEDFVRNFARRHCAGADVRAMPIDWHGEWDEEAGLVLPRMFTDVTIEWPDRKVILDCKFYKDALVTREGRHRLHSSHLYQLSAYLQNKARHTGWDNVEGLLLYPAVAHELDLRLNLLGHRIRIISIDLDQNWSRIETALLRVLEPAQSRRTIVQSKSRIESLSNIQVSPNMKQ